MENDFFIRLDLYFAMLDVYYYKWVRLSGIISVTDVGYSDLTHKSIIKLTSGDVKSANTADEVMDQIRKAIAGGDGNE